MAGKEEGQCTDRWRILTLLIAARVAITIQLQPVGAVGPLLLADPSFYLGYAGLGALIGAYLLPGAFVALPAAWLAVRFGERRMVLAGLLLAPAGGLAFAAAPAFATAFGARLVAGAGTALLNVVLSAMLMARFTGPALAPAMGGFLAAYPFAVGLSLVVLPALGTAIVWRGAMLVVAAACAVTLAAAPFALAGAPARAAPAGSAGPKTTDLLPHGEWGAGGGLRPRLGGVQRGGLSRCSALRRRCWPSAACRPRWPAHACCWSALLACTRCHRNGALAMPRRRSGSRTEREGAGGGWRRRCREGAACVPLAQGEHSGERTPPRPRGVR